VGVLHIAFVAINLVVPYWIWTKVSSGPPVKVEWPAAEKTMARLLEASGGLNCPTQEVVKHWRALCDKSLQEYSEKDTVIYRQQLGNQMYSCEVRKDSLQIKIVPEEPASENEPCLAYDSRQTLNLSPAFVLTLAGSVNSMSFVGLDGERHSFSVRNCRRKLKRAPASVSSHEMLEDLLGQDAKDPAEFRIVNRLCWVYDAAPGWNRFRQQFKNHGEL